mgnify:CR=1 FL=1
MNFSALRFLAADMIAGSGRRLDLERALAAELDEQSFPSFPVTRKLNVLRSQLAEMFWKDVMYKSYPSAEPRIDMMDTEELYNSVSYDISVLYGHRPPQHSIHNLNILMSWEMKKERVAKSIIEVIDDLEIKYQPSANVVLIASHPKFAPRIREIA